MPKRKLTQSLQKLSKKDKTKLKISKEDQRSKITPVTLQKNYQMTPVSQLVTNFQKDLKNQIPPRLSVKPPPKKLLLKKCLNKIDKFIMMLTIQFNQEKLLLKTKVLWMRLLLRELKIVTFLKVQDTMPLNITLDKLSLLRNHTLNFIQIKTLFMLMEMKIPQRCQKRFKVVLSKKKWFQMVPNSFKKLPKNKRRLPRKLPYLRATQTQAQILILTLIEKFDSLI